MLTSSQIRGEANHNQKEGSRANMVLCDVSEVLKYEIIEVNNCSEVVAQFASMLHQKDLDGALGVAQVLWCLCDDQKHFSDIIAELCQLCSRSSRLGLQAVRDLISDLASLHYRPEDSSLQESLPSLATAPLVAA